MKRREFLKLSTTMAGAAMGYAIGKFIAERQEARLTDRRTASDRTSDWLRNLEHDPHARVRIADAALPGRRRPIRSRQSRRNPNVRIRHAPAPVIGRGFRPARDAARNLTAWFGGPTRTRPSHGA